VSAIWAESSLTPSGSVESCGAALLDLAQQVLGPCNAGGVLAGRLPIDILDEIPTAFGQQWEELAKRHLLIKGRMAAVIDDHVQRARLDPGGDRPDLFRL